jgi:hypothetical protein
MKEANCAHLMWRDVGGLFGICMQRKVLWHLPDEDLAIVSPGRCSSYALTHLAIVGRRCDQRVVERTPIYIVSAATSPSELGFARTSRCRGRQQCARGREGSGRELGRARR